MNFFLPNSSQRLWTTRSHYTVYQLCWHGVVILFRAPWDHKKKLIFSWWWRRNGVLAATKALLSKLPRSIMILRSSFWRLPGISRRFQLNAFIIRVLGDPAAFKKLFNAEMSSIRPQATQLHRGEIVMTAPRRFCHRCGHLGFSSKVAFSRLRHLYIIILL